MKSVIVYSRAKCHLCHEAIALIEQSGVVPEVVDIDTDADLRSRYCETVPVVLVDGVERFHGRVDARLLRRLL